MEKKMEQIKNYEELLGMRDMLQGNLNRMCVSNNIHEIDQQYDYARKRLAAIYSYAVSQQEVTKNKLDWGESI